MHDGQPHPPAEAVWAVGAAGGGEGHKAGLSEARRWTSATEVAIVWSFLKGYNVIRDWFGSSAVTPAVAAAHARQVGTLPARRDDHAT